ncbi:Uncharacterized glycosyl hydrolase Rv2006/MT2062 [Legionella wadsworthii]|uniref:Uncharacterized glycosyl hydrolase Rv2006/MT2062 n=1 Tax=Legionella wadsworthii TaxID=28088 RepID=A0A378LUY7_9GAMM|nr:glycosyl hydrolase family 65 protein [Legionella wadsworthii]STY29638.1 Uncharacterized glycosyl hydrolase Rv2006/MT2062 [Legionella wadsworthii]
MSHWIISHRSFDANLVRLRETISTLGNGYFATRGAHEDSVSDIHYPGTYLAGVYNRSTSKIVEKELINEDLVNLPNWLPVTFKINDEDWVDVSDMDILSYREILHLKNGMTKRTITFKDKEERIFTVNSLRFVSQHNKHIAALRYSITAHNWQGKILIRSSIMGSVHNNGVQRYRELNNHHLEILNLGHFSEEYLFLQTRTKTSHIEISEVIKTEIFQNNKKLTCHSTIIEEEQNIHQCFELEIKPFEKVSIHKLLSLFYSKDRAIHENLYEAKKLITKAPSFKELLREHKRSWRHLWEQSDIEMDSKNGEQRLIRLHIFHTLQSISKHSKSIDYGAPARGLHGEAYRGHVFWDELYILPFFFYQFPDIARSLLMYRYYRLDAARMLAQENGFKGAMFPWQSSSNGEEETQKFHLNPQSSTWGPDNSHNQRHVNLAIIYNIWNYYQITKDISFMIEYGAEIIFEIAKFLCSITTFNPIKNQYEIIGVMGPDEYHESHPYSTSQGLKNNSYTNIMTVWALEKALELTKILSKKFIKNLFENLNITDLEISKWKHITSNMFVPFHQGLISQFEGYENLKEFDWNRYKAKYSNLERLDRILKAEGIDPNQYQIAKQPDTLMLYFLLEEQEVKQILLQLGYPYNEEIKKNTIDYYLKRTSHGSTLSKITFASLLLKYSPQKAKELYQEALVSDIEDTQGGTTQEGIHLGVMTATISVLFKDYTGLKITKGILTLDPKLPDWISRLKFSIVFQQNRYEIEITPQECYVKLVEFYNLHNRIVVYNQMIELILDERTCVRSKAQKLQTENISE